MTSFSLNTWRQNPYVRLMRLDKPIGNFLLLWPTLWALWLAGQGSPDPWIVLIFVLGVIVMRAAGCVINDFADRKVDGFVERTAHRPLATGELSSRQAIFTFFWLILFSFLLVLLLNWQTILLSTVALFLAALYPFMKRYTHLPQVFLGAAFGWAIPMAYMAVSESVPHEAWLLFLANVCWVMVYDTMYAMVDRDDDIKVGIKSTAVLFGHFDKFWIGVFQLLFLLLLTWIGQAYELGIYYHLGLGIAAIIAIYHQRLIANRQREHCFRAFLHNNTLGAIIFVGLVLDYTL
ncbi:MAG: 4-hydroxybenzoate polyprenyltransferase [Zetaproteobacteria bacterium CG2_30_46_52]|nr:MAG: 4-hydroxybenzoate polyprenyltransferase [Zetaproteobacteria bacterium CG2_30_46_52]